MIAMAVVGFVAGITFVYSCGGGGSSSSAAGPGTVTITAAGSAAYLPSMSFTAAPVGWYGVMNVGSQPNSLYASVNLPDGATITEFSYTAYDNDGAADTTAYLYRTDATPIASVDTSALLGTISAPTATTTSISAPVVDNSNHGYFVRMELPGGGGAVGAICVSISYSL